MRRVRPRAEIDAHLTDALDLALSDTVTLNHDELNGLLALLRRIEHETGPLPRGSRHRVRYQIEAVTTIAYALWDNKDPRVLGPWLLQLALHAAREVVAPLLYPPFLIPRRAGKPTYFPDFFEVQELLKGEDGLRALSDRVGAEEMLGLEAAEESGAGR